MALHSRADRGSSQGQVQMDFLDETLGPTDGGGATLDHIPEWLKLRHS